MNPTAPGQNGVIGGTRDGSTSGSPQPAQPSPIFNHVDVVARLVAAETKVQEIEHQLVAGRKKKRSPVQLEASIRVST